MCIHYQSGLASNFRTRPQKPPIKRLIANCGSNSLLRIPSPTLLTSKQHFFFFLCEQKPTPTPPQKKSNTVAGGGVWGAGRGLHKRWKEQCRDADATVAPSKHTSQTPALAGPYTRGSWSFQTLRQPAIPGNEQLPPTAYKILEDITNMQIVQEAQVRVARPKQAL